jgi:hypothetical protein
MRTAHGNDQHSLLRNGYASFCNSVRARFIDPCEPQLKLDRSQCTQSKKSHVNDLRKRRVHSSSCAPCHCTAMVRRCTDNRHSILSLALQYLSNSLIKLVSLTY